jgi:hypothetical protein
MLDEITIKLRDRVRALESDLTRYRKMLAIAEGDKLGRGGRKPAVPAQAAPQATSEAPKPRKPRADKGRPRVPAQTETRAILTDANEAAAGAAE